MTVGAVVDIVTTGYLTLDDLVLHDDHVVRDALGGGALYAAVGARVWGLPVGIHACAGGDYPPRHLRSIEEGGIDTSGVTVGPDRSLRLWLLEEDEARKQQLPKLASATVAEMDAKRGPLPAAYRGAAGFHVATSLPATQAAAVRAIREVAPAAIVTLDVWTEAFFDAGLYRDPEFLAGVDAFLPSDKEVEAIWGLADLPSTLRALAAGGPRSVAVKLGGRGCLLFDRARDAFWEMPAVPVRAVDTTGAGDAFCGGFLAGLLVTGDPLEAALRGTVSASFVVEGHGALSAMGREPAEAERRLAALRPRIRQVWR